MKYGRFKIISEIGSGGMAKVFLAEDPVLNRHVALKVIHPHLTSDRKMLERFAVEAKTAAALKSTNIIEIYDFGLQDGNQYFVMEYVEGYSLGFLINSHDNKPFSPEFCASVVFQASRGLMVAEKHNVVHRDIKPDNLIVNSDGVLKIADFGLVRHEQLDSSSTSATIWGSPHYISPEQIANSHLTPKADQWSLGVTLYYCMTGMLPFTGLNLPEIMDKIRQDPHKPVLEINPSADPDLADLSDILLRKNPAERGEGAAWLTEKLRKYLGDKGNYSPEAIAKNTVSDMELSPNHGLVQSEGEPLSMESTALLDSFAPPTGLSSTKQSNDPKPLWKTPLVWVSIFIFGWLIAISLLLSLPRGDKVLIEDLNIHPDNLTMRVGAQVRLTTQIMPYNAVQSVIWETAVPLVASVSNGLVTGHDTGTSDITAVSVIDPTIKAKCRVKVIFPSVSNLEISHSKIELYVGESFLLKTKVLPNFANQAVKWQVSKPGVLNLEKGRIRALRPGTVTITAQAADNPKIKQPCKVLVKKRPKRRRSAKLKITSSPPHAKIYINGEDWGITPMRHFKKIGNTKVQIELSHRSYPPKDTVVVLNLGRENRVHIKFE